MLEVVPFNYDEVKEDIVQRFVDKGYDANVDGSNAALLANVLSHVISMLNINVAFNTSEMILSTAQKEENVLNIARQMGYEAQNKISYTYKITVQAKKATNLSDDDTRYRIYEIPKYTEFTSGSNKYYYMGETDDARWQSSNADISNNIESSYKTIEIKEGILKKADDYPDILNITTTTVLDANNEIQTQSFIDIPLTNIEDDGIELFLTYIDEFGIEHIDEPWTKTIQFLVDKDTSLSRKFMRLEDLTTRTPRCYFSLAGIGNELRLNTVIKANVLISSGSAGKANGKVELPSTISHLVALYDGEDIEKNQTLLITGDDEESSDSIKLNAPLFHNSANRAVVKGDYISICNRQSIVEQTQVWGGDEEIPALLGKVFISIVPAYRDKIITSDELLNTFNIIYDSIFIKNSELRSDTYNINNQLSKAGIFDMLDEFKIITMTLIHRHPIYINFDFNIDVVSYNLKKSKAEINQSVFNLINSYFNATIEKYESNYYHSNLIKRVDTELTDLTGVNISLNNTISLFEQNINSEREQNIGEKSITIFLSAPHQEYINQYNEIITGILPDISTSNFITDGDNISVDWNNPIYTDQMLYADNISFNIKYNGLICGKYYVKNKVRKHIRIDLYIKGEGALIAPYENSPLLDTMFSEERKLSLKYNSSNFKLFKNSIPRLKSIVFEQ